MNTDICDICKKPIKSQKSLTGSGKLQYRVKIKSIEEGFSMAGWFRNTRNLDVCPDCMNKFAEFVKEGGAKHDQ